MSGFNVRNIGINVHTLRKAARMSQETLAEKLNLSRNAMGAIERGDTIPTMETTLLICQVFGISPNDLLSADLVGSIQIDPELVSLCDEMSGFWAEQKSRVYSIMGTVIAGVKAENI